MGLRSIIKHELVRMEEVTPKATSRAGGACLGEPSVRVLELEGHAHALEVTCGCGVATVIELQYPAPASVEQ